MRHLLLALMIALLPLRAWVGDAMAVSMWGAVASPNAAAQAACPDHAHTSDTASAQQPAEHGAQPHAADSAHTAQHSPHPHSVCDVCNGPVLPGVAQHSAAAAQVHARLTRPATRFASVALPQGTKPPIS
ncbi:MAG: hypothetical protein RLZZ352_432 [Pseudomonadota bacterium]|jgi:hypothetical protein